MAQPNLAESSRAFIAAALEALREERVIPTSVYRPFIRVGSDYFGGSMHGLSADARRLRQIVFNLLSNSFKFTPRGGTITLSAKIIGEDVQIAVADNGPGLSPDVKANVFERFSAKSQAGARAGAGLGLALVNRFLELHDGWVEIESGKSGGTLVRCHLPRRIHDGEPRPEVSGDRRTAYL